MIWNGFKAFISWVYISYLKDAVTVSPLIRAFITLILTQFSIVIKCWRTDGEFLNTLIAAIIKNSAWYISSRRHMSSSRTVLSNRVQTLKNMERSISWSWHSWRLPLQALATAVLTNIQSSSTLETPRTCWDPRKWSRRPGRQQKRQQGCQRKALGLGLRNESNE